MNMTRLKLAAAAITVTALLSACGGHSLGTSGTDTSSVSGTSGAVSTDTAYWAESAQTPPDYIFPMTPTQACSPDNVQQFSALMFRPLYWFGNHENSGVDYNYSVADAPVWSDGDKTVTIPMKHWQWSNGQPVTSRDVAFFMNIYKADPANNFCDYVPGEMPGNVVSMSTPNSHTLVMHLSHAVSPTWFLYNELSQLTPIPLAWDRTSLSEKAPSESSTKLPDETKAGAQAVWNFLNSQAKDISTYATSPLWRVVDGPWRLTGYTASGEVTMQVNKAYSGSPKPKLKEFVELPFTSNSAEMNQILSGGPKAVTVGYLPPEDIPQEANAKSAGYVADNSYLLATDFFPLNLHNPIFGPVFRQLYFRQAFQHLVDQPGWVSAFLHGDANQTYGPVPGEPTSPLTTGIVASNPYPFSVADATALLTANGWKVVKGGITTCVKPGTAKGDCGAGVKAGLGLEFNLDYVAGVPAVESEMNDLQAMASQAGIKLDLTSHPFNTIEATATPCKPAQSSCKWTAENWGLPWIYSPLPTGEGIFKSGAESNYSNYSDPEADKLIENTLTTSAADEHQALVTYSNYLAKTLPVVFEPTPEGNPFDGGPALISKYLSGYQANTEAYITPELWTISSTGGK